MQINYIEVNGKKLFSFNRHDYQKFESGEFIDGGFDYTRSNSTVQSGNIKDLIGDIREQFTWGQNYDKDNVRLLFTEYKLLKDLDSDHILGILTYFTLRLNTPQEIDVSWKGTHLIFLYELQYRNEQLRKTETI
jgi:hypothetical protein